MCEITSISFDCYIYRVAQ